MSTTPVAEEERDYERYWNRLKESARYHPANRFRYTLIANRLKRYVAAFSGVLDMGCGDARLLRYLRTVRPEARFSGCDVSQRVIDIDSREEPLVKFFQADVTAPDFADRARQAVSEPPDMIVCSEVIEHVEDDDSLLANAATLLAPGGYLVLTTQSGPRYRIDRELLGHLRHYQRGDLERKVRAAGFQIIESFNCGFPVLTAQKIVAEKMFGTVMKATASEGKPPLVVRTIMNLMYAAMIATPLRTGPQLVLVARRSSPAQAVV